MKDYEGMIIVHGDLYRIDRDKNELVDAEWQDYTFPIALLDMNLDKNGHIILQGYYDTDTKEIVALHDILSQEQEEQLEPFSIPRRLLLGEKPSAEVVRQCNEQSLAQQDGYLVVDKELSDRLNGKLQVIAIDGIDYKIDTINLEISQVEKPELKFAFEFDAFFQQTEKLYNTVTKEPVSENSAELLKNPGHIARLTFPKLSGLDLIGFNSTGHWSTTSGLSNVDWKADPRLITSKPYLDSPQQNQAVGPTKKMHENSKLSAGNEQMTVKKRGRHL